jgi:hypothetical protein
MGATAERRLPACYVVVVLAEQGRSARRFTGMVANWHVG